MGKSHPRLDKILNEIKLDDLETAFLNHQNPKPRKKPLIKPSIDHQTLQLHGQKYLYVTYGCKYAATEVKHDYAISEFGNLDEELREIGTSKTWYGSKPRYIYDILGIRRYYGKDEIVGVEVKISLEDLRRGFCIAGCNRNFILIPKELLNAVKSIPDSIGILFYNGEKVRRKRDAEYKDTDASINHIKQKILERNSSQIRFLFLNRILGGD